MKIFFSIFIISVSIFTSNNKYGVFLKFMYKPSKSSVNEILIHNLETDEMINNKLIKYYLDRGEIKLAKYYSKKNKKIESEYGFIVNAELFLELKNNKDAIKLLKIALFKYNSETAFYLLQKLHYRKQIKIDDFYKIIEKGVEINPYLISYYYFILVKNSNQKKQKELFERYLSYNNNLEITEKEFNNINLNTIEKLYYLEKIIAQISLQNKKNWAKKLYKNILIKNPYLINLRRVLILR